MGLKLRNLPARRRLAIQLPVSEFGRFGNSAARRFGGGLAAQRRPWLRKLPGKATNHYVCCVWGPMWRKLCRGKRFLCVFAACVRLVKPRARKPLHA